jgi:hypothetical protein
VMFSEQCALVKTWCPHQPTPGSGRLHFDFARGCRNFQSFDLQLDGSSRVRFSQKALRGSAQHRIEIQMKGGSCIWLYLPEDDATSICKFLAQPGIPIEVQSGLSPRFYNSRTLDVQLGFSTGRKAGHALQQRRRVLVSAQQSKAPGALPIKRKPVIPTLAMHPIFFHPKYTAPDLCVGRVSPSSSSSISSSMSTESAEATPRSTSSMEKCAGLPPNSVGSGGGYLVRETNYSAFGALRPSLDRVHTGLGERRPRPLVMTVGPVRNVVDILGRSHVVDATTILTVRRDSCDRLVETRCLSGDSIEASGTGSQIASSQSSTVVSGSIPAYRVQSQMC